MAVRASFQSSSVKLQHAGSKKSSSSPDARVLRPLHGIRALFSCIIVMGHVLYALGIPPLNHDWHAMMSVNWVLRCLFPMTAMAMEVFFLLTGLLAVYHLVPAMETGPPLKVTLSYLRRRALRLIPQYYLTVLLYWTLIQAAKASGYDSFACFLCYRPTAHPPDASLASLTTALAFYHNHQEMAGFVSHTWNLAVQAQFYVLLPLLLMLLQPQSRGFRGRVAGLAVAMVCVSLAWRTYHVKVTGIRLPIASFQVPGDAGFRSFHTFFSYFYASLPARLSTLGLGMLLGLLALSPSTQAAIRKHWALTTIVVGFAKLLIVVHCFAIPDIEYSPSKDMGQAAPYVAFVGVLGLTLPLGLALMIGSVAIDAGPIIHISHAMTSHRLWSLPSTLSYSIFLLHLLCLRVVWAALTALGLPPPRLLYSAVLQYAREGTGTTHVYTTYTCVLQVLAVLGIGAATYGMSFVAAIGLDALADHITSRLSLA